MCIILFEEMHLVTFEWLREVGILWDSAEMILNVIYLALFWFSWIEHYKQQSLLGHPETVQEISLPGTSSSTTTIFLKLWKSLLVLRIILKNYTPQKDKLFLGNARFNFTPSPMFSVCPGKILSLTLKSHTK